MGQESESSLAASLWPRVSHTLQSRCQSRLQSLQGSTGDGSTSVLPCFPGCWLETSVPYHMGPLHRLLAFSHSNIAGFPKSVIRERGGEHKLPRWKLQSFVISAVFFWSHRPPLVECGCEYQWCEYQETGIVGGHLGGWLPQC